MGTNSWAEQRSNQVLMTVSHKCLLKIGKVEPFAVVQMF